MVETPQGDELPLLTRISLLEAKVRLISIVLKGATAIIATALIAYFFGYSH
jgi:hypothetical protein